jgi:hypothetical protein
MALVMDRPGPVILEQAELEAMRREARRDEAWAFCMGFVCGLSLISIIRRVAEWLG